MALLIAVLIIVLGVTGCAQMAPRGGVGSAPEAKDMALVGFNDLQNRSAYQPVIHHQGDRFIAYVGHHGGTALNPSTGRVEPNGTSVVDVTDPGSPKYLAHIPGSAAGTGEAGGAADGARLRWQRPAERGSDKNLSAPYFWQSGS